MHTGASGISQAQFGRGSGPIHLDEVGYVGSEEKLLDCRHNSVDDCLHFEDASVRCNTSKH